MTKNVHPKLVEYAETKKEAMVVEHTISGYSQPRIAELLGISERTVRTYLKNVRSRAAQHGFDPENDLTHETGKDFRIKGVSSLYKNPDAGPNEPSLQWVKTEKNAQELYETMKSTIELMCQEIPAIPEITRGKNYEEDLLCVIPIGDAHIGMLAWDKETGDNHDLDIGIRDLLCGIDRVIRSTPKCGECLIINTGDFFHSDLMNNRTWRNGHDLDVDGRWMKIHEAGVNAMRRCIETALDHHDKVTVINAIGNHDDHSSMMLSICLKNVYEKNPRVTIDASPKNIYSYRFGSNFICTHHGHEIKADRLPLVMANEWPMDWGETEFRVWYCGHVHHDSVKEYAGCTVESVRVLCGRDAYAAKHGYYAQRDLKSVVHHRVYGPIERHIVPIKQIRDIQKGIA